MTRGQGEDDRIPLVRVLYPVILMPRTGKSLRLILMPRYPTPDGSAINSLLTPRGLFLSSTSRYAARRCPIWKNLDTGKQQYCGDDKRGNGLEFPRSNQ
eukprot:scaffold868_cov351-Pavlova_lutheri.AAC.15